MRVLIFVTHLLGTGHLSRALTLGRAFAVHGHSVDLVSGGTSVPNLDTSGITLHQLPPVKSDGVNFTRLLDAENQLVTAQYLSQRQAMACKILDTIAPDILITELFPFGRRVLRAEFTALLEAAHLLPNKPQKLCSIRDILAPPSNPQKALNTEAIITRFYDRVLVHSDPTQTPLQASWPVTAELETKLIYTGYVAPQMPVPHPDGVGKGEVLVTAGGGSVGDALFQTAVKAAKANPQRRWRLLVGGANAADRIDRLKKQANGAAIIIEPTRPDFRQMLPHAAAVVAMCGYNTAMDLLQAGTPAVFVPFDAGGELEQSLRAESLAKQPQFSVVKSADLTPERMLAALKTVHRNTTPDLSRFHGANQTVRIAEELAESNQ